MSYGFPGAGEPILNPPMPYNGPIQGMLTHGMMIFVNGYVPPGANRFAVNLSCGASDSSDIALHFNPRFEGANQVIRNTMQHGGAWGNEERHGVFPFQHAQQFEMIILVQNDCYKVAVNGQHFAEYRHRIPKERVNTLALKGDVNIVSVRYQQPSGFPAAPAGAVAPPAGAVPRMPPMGGTPGLVYNPPVPYNGSIPGGLYPGRIVSLTGVPNPNASRFTINLSCGGSRDIALHFDVRFNFGVDRNVIVRNSEIRGKWGSEERHVKYFPFMPNGNFDIMIMCEQNCFKVAVNGQHFVEYRHRIQPLHSIDQLAVSGDVRLSQLRVP